MGLTIIADVVLAFIIASLGISGLVPITDPDELVPELKKRIKELDFVIKEPEMKVLDTTLNTYIIAIDAFCKGTYEESLEVRSLR